MQKIRTWVFLVLLLCGALLLPQTSSAINIVYEATDLTDTTVGEDLWEYKYTVSGHTFNVDDNFSILFDYNLYGDIEDFPLAPAGWDVEGLDPDTGLPDDGYFDAYSLLNNAPLPEMFTVEFVWLGGTSPGAQPFELYDPNFALVGTGNTVSGLTPIPEPSTWVLLTAGLFGLAGLNRWKKRSRQ